MKAQPIAHIWKLLTGQDILVSDHADNIYAPCPFAPYLHAKGTDTSGSFSIKVNKTGNSVGYCWACKWTGNLEWMLKSLSKLNGVDYSAIAREVRKYENPTLTDIWDAIDDLEDGHPDEPIDERLLNAFPVPTTKKYTEQELQDWDIRIDKKGRRIVYPVRDREGILRGAVGRTIDPTEVRKYHNYWNFKKVGFLLGEHLDIGSDVLILTEGVRDAIAVRSATGIHTCALMGCYASKLQIQKIKLFRKVIVFLDNDLAGQQGVIMLLKHLGGFTVCLVVDYSGLSAKDPGEMSPEIIRERVENALPVLFL